MATLTVTLLSSLLDLPDPSPQVQRWAWQVGTSSRADSLLAKLAAHPALTDELDDELAGIDMAATRAAWLARPGRPKKVVLQYIGAEKRSTVLRAIAVMPDLPAETYDAVAEKLGKTALEDLIVNEAAAMSARVRAAERLGQASDIYADTSDALSRVIHQHPPIARALLDGVNSCDIAVQCLDGVDHVTKQDVERLVGLAEALVAESGDNARVRSIAEHFLVQAVTSLLSYPVTDDQRTRLRACVKTLKKKIRWIRSDTMMLKTIDALPGTKGTPGHPAAAAISKAKSDAEALKAYATATKAKVDPVILLIAAGQAPKVSAAAFSTMLDPLQLEHEQFQSVWRTLRDPGKLAVMYVDWRPSHLDDALARLDDPVAGLIAIAQRLMDGGYRLPDDIIKSAFFTPELIVRMPAGLFVHSLDVLSPQALELIQDMMVSSLNPDNGLDALLALSEGFTGSLEELFQVAGAL